MPNDMNLDVEQLPMNIRDDSLLAVPYTDNDPFVRISVQDKSAVARFISVDQRAGQDIPWMRSGTSLRQLVPNVSRHPQ
jgi:hypothetical protein